MTAGQNTKVSESVVGQSLASVLASSDADPGDGSGRLQYPQNVHAAFDVERYVVDENGLRYEKPTLEERSTLSIFPFLQ